MKYLKASVVVGVTLTLASAAVVNTAGATEQKGEASLPMAFFAERITANSHSAYREHTDLGRAVRTVLGISFVDIEKYGLFGGPNSIWRKPFGP